MNYNLKIDRKLNTRLNSILYAYINQWQDDSLLTDLDIRAFTLLVKHKLLNIRNGLNPDKIINENTN